MKTISKKAKLAGAMAVAVLCGSAAFGVRQVRAQGVTQICTFTSDASDMNYSDAYHRDYLTFTWDNSTGAVSYAEWAYTYASTPYTFYLQSTGFSSTVAAGYDATNSTASRSAATLYFDNGTASPNRLDGLLANFAAIGGQGTFAGVMSQSSSAWLAGYGTVECGEEAARKAAARKASPRK